MSGPEGVKEEPGAGAGGGLSGSKKVRRDGDGEGAGPSDEVTYRVLKTPEEVFADFSQRRLAALNALTEESDVLWEQCDPDKDNLCLYAYEDGSWEVALPVPEVPPELPEPAIGINFARDGLDRRNWLSLVAGHTDSWLIAVAFFLGASLNKADRKKLFNMVNELPTLFEIVSGKKQEKKGVNKAVQPDDFEAMASKSAKGRQFVDADINPNLKGKKIQLYWPDDNLWYHVTVESVNVRTRTAKIIYANDEIEELDLDEIIRDKHISVLE